MSEIRAKLVNNSSKCRLCLKTIGTEKKSYQIEDDVRLLFLEVTGISLVPIISSNSQSVCELCLRTLQHFSAVKSQFIENQYKLLHNQKRKIVESDSESESEELQLIASSPKKIKIEKVVGWMDGSGSGGDVSRNDDMSEEVEVKTVNKDKEIYECSVCGMHFTLPYSLRRHLKNLHKLDYTPALKQRIKLSDLTPQQLQNKCKVCLRQFANSWSLSRHINNVHKNESSFRKRDTNEAEQKDEDDGIIVMEVKCEPLELEEVDE